MLRKMIASVLASAAVLAASGAGPLKIRGTAFANWWRTGETVCFKGNQPIPENDRIRVKVTDVTGKPVFTGEVDGREFNEKLEDVVSRETDYRRIRTCPEDKHVVQMSFSLAKTLVNIIRAPLFDEEGAVTGEIRSLLDDCDDFLDELARM